MRLSDTITETAEVEPEAPPRRRRPWGLLFFLLACVALLALALRHGAGVVLLDPGDAVVVEDVVGGLPGEPRRVITEDAFALYVPVLQTARVLRLNDRALSVDATARTAEGVALSLRRARARYRVRAVDLLRAVGALGADPDGWDRAVSAEVGAALLDAYGRVGLIELADDATVTRALAAAEKKLGDRLAARGVELISLRPPAWRVDSDVQGTLAGVAQAKAQAARLRAEADTARAGGDAEVQAAVAEARKAHDAARAELEAEIEAAREALGAARARRRRRRHRARGPRARRGRRPGGARRGRAGDRRGRSEGARDAHRRPAGRRRGAVGPGHLAADGAVRTLFTLLCALIAIGATFAAVAVRVVPPGQALQGEARRLEAGLHLAAPWDDLQPAIAPPFRAWGGEADPLAAPTADGETARLDLVVYATAPRDAIEATLKKAIAAQPTDALLTPERRTTAWKAVTDALRAAHPDAEARLAGIALRGADDTRAEARRAEDVQQRLKAAQDELTEARAKLEAARRDVAQRVTEAKAQHARETAELRRVLSAEVADLRAKAEAYAQQRAAEADAQVATVLAGALDAEAEAEAQRDRLTAATLVRPGARLYLALEAVRRLEPGSLKGRTLAAWRDYFLPPAVP
ncbi:MAG: hypothetical protein H6704_07840 [Myxococcales bacterium]|nr:hypothetical protein [Myxococcales bacterium]